MTNINNIALLLLDSINKNSLENKTTFMKNIKIYKEKKEKEHNQLLEDINYYTAKYENKRNENNTLYEEYLNKRFPLYKKWLNSKKKVDLDNLFKLQKPNFNDIPDIYTKIKPRTLLK